jgi:hypothetical protein
MQPRHAGCCAGEEVHTESIIAALRHSTIRLPFKGKIHPHGLSIEWAVHARSSFYPGSRLSGTPS